jgi:serine kinase of HPr protein (carbohydrate metabolism regulator)
MADAPAMLVHATAVAVAGRGVLILGPSGAGKSDLALRLVTAPYLDAGRNVPIRLISDDQVLVERHGDGLLASPPATIAGKMEVRGIGILSFPYETRVDIRLAVRLAPAVEIERLPERDQGFPILGVEIPAIAVDGRLPGAPMRVVVAAMRMGLA